jgi:hypothetical protein
MVLRSADAKARKDAGPSLQNDESLSYPPANCRPGRASSVLKQAGVSVEDFMNALHA